MELKVVELVYLPQDNDKCRIFVKSVKEISNQKGQWKFDFRIIRRNSWIDEKKFFSSNSLLHRVTESEFAVGYVWNESSKIRAFINTKIIIIVNHVPPKKDQ
jgi:hypothetical protein